MDNQVGHIIGKYLVNQFKAEAGKAGHKLSGKLIKSVTYDIQRTLTGMEISFTAEGYGIALSRGVKPERIPFSGTTRGSGGGGRSKYIQGLVKYVRARMGIRNKKKALGVAFAIAKNHKKKGMPLKTKGQGTKWIDKAIAGTEEELRSIVEIFVGRELAILFDDLIKQAA